MTENLSPRYDTYCFIYLGNEIVGKARTAQEADIYCKSNYKYQWDHGYLIKDIKKREKLYNDLPLLTYKKN